MTETGRKMILFIFFSLCLFPRVIEANTTIITARTDNEIIMGADSRATDWIGENVTSLHNICKIKQIRNIFIASSHASSIKKDGKKTFDVADIATQVFSGEGSMDDRINTLDALIKWYLREAMENMRQDNRTSFNRLLNYDRVMLGVTIAIVTNTFPVFYKREYKLVSSSEEPTIIITSVAEDHTDRLEAAKVDISFQGAYRAIMDRLKGRSIDKETIVENIREWITLEADKVPKMVGLPIDILRITPNGAEWIQHKKPECPEIDKTFFQHPN